jgi:hypothetical protein
LRIPVRAWQIPVPEQDPVHFEQRWVHKKKTDGWFSAVCRENLTQISPCRSSFSLLLRLTGRKPFEQAQQLSGFLPVINQDTALHGIQNDEHARRRVRLVRQPRFLGRIFTIGGQLDMPQRQ